MIEDSLWSKSLKERIEAEKYFTPSELSEIKLSRLRKFGFSNDLVIPEGNHLRLNSFWLFIGVGNSSSELWDQLPRRDLTLGEPHLFERINENDKRISKAVYHQQLKSLLKIGYDRGYVQERLPDGLSYQFIGNINISDIVAKNETEVVLDRTQKDDLKNKEKLIMVINIIQACNPAFIVTSPKIFNVLRKHFKLNLELKQTFKSLSGEIYTCKIHLPNTVFIRLPQHVSRCGNWIGVKKLILEGINVAFRNGWHGKL
ncbi:hypothetical protein AWH48_11330 [Domibacillus aminovorans]|uniref:Uncharacterized protein n=1 Tax=Domibacillus aminovorans TaxID=29332 RepID=A0A177KLK6_9BACI|nr:hypothetical protein [Domibacillus aminovorans]OAH53856.1 hypothetical protein AWH48_11330 [Domibacillus aminovorans]